MLELLQLLKDQLTLKKAQNEQEAKMELNPQQLVVIKAVFPEGRRLLLIGWKYNIY